MRKVGWSLLALIAIGLLGFGGAEIEHRLRFGHFVAHGLHVDVILGNSAIGSHDTYFTRLWNLSPGPFDIEGCMFPSDVVGVPDSILYRWDVQKRDPSS